MNKYMIKNVKYFNLSGITYFILKYFLHVGVPFECAHTQNTTVLWLLKCFLNKHKCLNIHKYVSKHSVICRNIFDSKNIIFLMWKSLSTTVATAKLVILN